jgi:hypothetical protein
MIYAISHREHDAGKVEVVIQIESLANFPRVGKGEKQRDPLKSSWPPAASNHRSLAEIWKRQRLIQVSEE